MSKVFLVCRERCGGETFLLWVCHPPDGLTQRVRVVTVPDANRNMLHDQLQSLPSLRCDRSHAPFMVYRDQSDSRQTDEVITNAIKQLEQYSSSLKHP